MTAFVLTPATMGERIPTSGEMISIVNKASGDVVAAHSRRVLPIDTLKIHIDRDLAGMSAEDFATKWIK